MAFHFDRRLLREARRSSSMRASELRNARHAAVWLVTVALLSSRVGAAQGAPPHALTTLPVADAAYIQLAALERVGCAPARISAHRPFRVRDVQRAVARFGSVVACAGPIADALASRFSVPATAPIPADVAPDLAAAARESEADEAAAFRVGARATVTATSLARGEFEPLWAGVRSRDEGTPPVVAEARGRVTWAASPNVVGVGELYAQTS